MYLAVSSRAKWAKRNPATIIATVRIMVKNATSVPSRSIFPDNSMEVEVVLAATSEDNVWSEASVRFMGFAGYAFYQASMIITLAVTLIEMNPIPL